jgi:hypothetical protein
MNIATPLRAVPALCALSLCVCATARGEEAEGVHFQHGDWEVACDNTLTCRIAGYCAEENYDEGCGSVLVTRVAGPDAPLEGEVTLADYGDDTENPDILTLRIDGKSKGTLKNQGNYPLTPAQIRALLAAARKDEIVEFGESFTLSGKGVSAVLLKADEVQGRIGTPGAFIRKGKKPEESVFPPRPVPVIQAAKVGKTPSRELTASEVAALKPLLQEYCDVTHNELILKPLDERHLLITMTPCWRGAYNWSEAYWVMDSAFQGPPKFVTSEANFYAGREISGSFKSRGLGDCWEGSKWIWDGQEFRLAEKWSTGMCRLIHAGGTWHLPTFVSKIVDEGGTPY